MSKAADQIQTAAVAWRNFNGALLEFRGALQRRDFEAAEAAQVRVSGNLDSYLDATLAAHREMDAEEKRGA